MLTKLTAVRKGIENIYNIKKYATKCRQGGPHMNELPVPCKPWGPWYKRQQSFYTKHLIFGFVWWLFSLGLAIKSNSLLLEYWGPPFKPGPPSDMVEDCDDDAE